MIIFVITIEEIVIFVIIFVITIVIISSWIKLVFGITW